MQTKKLGLLLEAEVAPRGKARFEARYMVTTGIAVSPGAPEHYQIQKNKWGTELRVYFNDDGLAMTLRAAGLHVEGPRRGYKSGKYKYRINHNKMWWKLVEDYGLRLGMN